MGPCVYDVDLEVCSNDKRNYGLSKWEDKTILHHLEDRMNKASEQLDFEQAKEYRDMIQHIHNLTKKQKIMSSDNTIRDVLVIVFLKAGCVFKSSSLDKVI